jgi:hypothetical protein
MRWVKPQSLYLQLLLFLGLPLLLLWTQGTSTASLLLRTSSRSEMVRAEDNSVRS